MKHLFLKIMTIVCVVTSVPALAGTKDGVGGGNGAKSTPEDLRSLLNHEQAWRGDTWDRGTIQRIVTYFLANWINYEGFFDPTTVSDPDLKNLFASEIFKKQYRQRTGSNELISELSVSKWESREKCLDENNEEVDASTAHRLFADVCFSESRLTRYSPEDLKVQVAALAAHEHLHHLGIRDEDLARKYQLYIESVFRIFSQSFGPWTQNWANLRLGARYTLTKRNGQKLNVLCVPKVRPYDFDQRESSVDVQKIETLRLNEGAQIELTDVTNEVAPEAFGNFRVACNNFPVRSCALNGVTFQLGSDVFSTGYPVRGGRSQAEGAKLYMKDLIATGACRTVESF